MKKRLLWLFVATLLPSLAQYIATFYQNYGIGLIVRILVHIIIPVIAVAYITKISFKKSFMLPLHFKNIKLTKQFALIGSIGATVIIAGAFFALRSLIDFGNISSNLKVNYGVTALTYPFIALAIVLINPFIEEYFWRGFVFRVFNKYWRGYWTGLLFALHHVIIIAGWFNWWQFLLVTVFLAIIGILFNWVYKKTDSIYATLITHTVADLVIVIIGFFILF